MENNSEKILRENEKRYRLLFENMLNGIAVCQMIFEHGRPIDFVYLEVNSAFESLTGLKNVVNRKVSEVIPGIIESDPELMEVYGRVARTGLSEKVETYVKSLDMWFSISVYGMGSGQFVAVFDVINERKKMIAALQASEERYRQLVESANSAIIRWRSDGVILFANRYANSFFGYEDDELVGKDVRILVPEAESTGAVLSSLVEDILTDPKKYINNVNQNICRDGRRVWLNWTNNPVFDDKGKVVEILTIGLDITERKQIEESLRNSELKLRALFDNMSSGVAVYEAVDNGEDFIIRDFNRAAERIEKVRKEEILDRRVTEVFPGVSDFGIFDVFKRVWKTGISESMPVKLYKDQRIIGWRENYIYKLFSGEIVAVYEDVTERKKAEEALIESELRYRKLSAELEARVRQRTAQLESSLKELDSFSHTVSHDLQTPLRAIDGYSHVILEDYASKLDERGREQFLKISSNIKKMGQLIDDLLKFSRLGRTELKFSEIDMNKLCGEAFESLKDFCVGRGIEFKAQDLPGAYGDIPLIREVMVNIFSNALKFTRTREKAIIEVGSEIRNGETVYYIRDNGVGFDMNFVDKLFQEFVRLHSRAEFEGTGIGLSIVQRIIHRHGGKVWAESTLDKGTTIHFSLPTKSYSFP